MNRAAAGLQPPPQSPISQLQFESELNLAGRVETRSGCNLAIVNVSEGSIGNAEDGVIGNVKQFGAELQVVALFDVECFEREAVLAPEDRSIGMIVTPIEPVVFQRIDRRQANTGESSFGGATIEIPGAARGGIHERVTGAVELGGDFAI